MALVVDNTPLSPTCNSYASVAVMDTYVTDRVPDPAVKVAWDALTDPLQAMYLVNATRALDSVCDWIGYRYSRDQKLDWPRYDAWIEGYLLDVVTFPQAVIDAACEMAIWSMQNAGLVSVSQNASFDSIKVGPIAIDFNEGVGGVSEKYFPDIIAMILRDYAGFSNPQLPNSQQLKTVKLIRA